MAQRFIGGICKTCGTPQFPKTKICVAPDCGEVGTQDDYPFADKISHIQSYTADKLTYSPDPPAYYGMINFEGGGRLMNDFCDIAPDFGVEVGMSMRLMFRVKDYDNNRGFRRYFWKATPTDEALASQKKSKGE